jgi:hypothetical protein
MSSYVVVYRMRTLHTRYYTKSRETSAIGTFLLELCAWYLPLSFEVMALLSAELCRDIKATSAAFKAISLIHDELTYLRKENLGEGKLAKDVWR